MKFIYESRTPLREGAWSLPETKLQINALRRILSKPLKAKDAPDVLYDIFGDDDLYDSIDYNCSPEDDCRWVIKYYLKDYIDNGFIPEENKKLLNIGEAYCFNEDKRSNKNYIYKNRKLMTEAYHFGGAYDINDDQYFTKEELLEFADEVIERLEKRTGHKYGISDLFTYNTFTITLCLYDIEEEFEEEVSIRVDQRKAKTLKKLIENYADFAAERFERLFNMDYRDFA